MFDNNNPDEVVKDFGEFVSKVADQVGPIQSALSKLEMALLALKVDNSCKNNTAVMMAATEVQSFANTLLHNVHTVGHAHMDTKHADKMTGEGPEDIDIGTLFEILFGRKGFNGRPH